MTCGEIWKDFFKKTVLTVIVAGFSSACVPARHYIPRWSAAFSSLSWVVAPFLILGNKKPAGFAHTA